MVPILVVVSGVSIVLVPVVSGIHDSNGKGADVSLAYGGV